MTDAGQLVDNEAHLWWLEPDTVAEPSVLDWCSSVLSPDEQQQQRRFIRAEDRHLYLVSHAAVRSCLSCYSTVAPRAWVFTRNAYGRPEIASPTLERRLRFNLSHTRGMVVVALAWEREIGVDVEDVARRNEVLRLARDVFAPDELRELGELPSAEQRKRFFELWTLKEAYLKARGMGLAIPLEDFSFRLRPGQPIGISFVLQDDPRTWQFALLQLSPMHQAALAVRRRADEPDLRLVRRGAPPLDCES